MSKFNQIFISIFLSCLASVLTGSLYPLQENLRPLTPLMKLELSGCFDFFGMNGVVNSSAHLETLASKYTHSKRFKITRIFTD